MRFTLTAAAKEAGVSKGTISKALKSGRLSGERQEDGSFQIDASELFRVYPRKSEQPVAKTGEKPSETVQRRTETGAEPGETAVELAVLRVELAREREERARERETAQETIAKLWKRLDAEQEERRALQRQLMPPEKPQEPEMVDQLRKQLEEVEGRMSAAVTALERVQEQAADVPGGLTPVKPSKGLLARLLGR